MSSEVSVKFTADEAQLWTALQKVVVHGTEQVRAGNERVGASTRKADQDLERFAARVRSMQATPMTRFAEQTARLDAALAANKLTAEEHAVALADEKAKLDALVAAADPVAQANARMAEETRRFAESVKRVQTTPLQEYEDRVRKLDAALAADALTVDQHATALADEKAKLDALVAAADPVAQANARMAEETRRFAESVKRVQTTPLQEYEDRVRKLDAALAADALTVEQHATALAGEKAKLEQLTAAATAEAAATARATEQRLRFNAAVASIQSSATAQYDAAIAKLNEQLAAGTLGAEAHARAVSQEKVTLDSLVGSAERVAGAARGSDEALDRLAAGVRGLDSAPVREYEARMTLLAQALAKGKLSQAEFDREADTARQKMDAMRKALDPAEAKAAEEIRRFAADVKKLQTTPLERFNAEMKRLQAALDLGALKQHQFDAAVSAARIKLDKETEAAHRAATAIGKVDGATAKQGATSGRVAGLTGGLLSQVTGLAAGYLSLQGAVGLATKFLEQHEAAAKNALDTHTALAKAQADAIKNMTGMATTDIANVLNRDALEITARTGVDVGTVTSTIAATMAPAGGDLAIAKSSTEAAGRLTLLDSAATEALAAGAATLARLTGERNAEANLGFIHAASEESLIKKNELVAKSLTPAIVAVTATVPKQDTKQAAIETAAAHGALTLAAADDKGEVSTTALNTLAIKMESFFRDAKFTGEIPDSFFGRLEFFQRDEQSRRQLLGDEGIGEAKTKKAIEGLLTGGNAIAAAAKDKAGKISFDAELFRTAAKRLESLTPALRLATAKNKSAAASELMKLGMPDKALAGFAAEERAKVIDETPEASGLSWLSGMIAEALEIPARAFDDDRQSVDRDLRRLTEHRNRLLFEQMDIPRTLPISEPGDLGRQLDPNADENFTARFGAEAVARWKDFQRLSARPDVSADELSRVATDPEQRAGLLRVQQAIDTIRAERDARMDRTLEGPHPDPLPKGEGTPPQPQFPPPRVDVRLPPAVQQPPLPQFAPPKLPLPLGEGRGEGDQRQPGKAVPPVEVRAPALDQAAATMLFAAEMMASAASAARSQKSEVRGQRSEDRNQQPDFAGRARREQAVAAG